MWQHAEYCATSEAHWTCGLELSFFKVVVRNIEYEIYCLQLLLCVSYLRSGPITSWQIKGGKWNSDRLYFLGLQNTMDGDCSREIKTLAPWKKSNDKPRECIEKQRHHFSDKGPYRQSCGFSSIHVWMWELDYKEGWAQKNWCFWIVVLGKTLESFLDYKEIQPVYLKEISPEYSLEGLVLKLKLQ